jgi:hypothetical protein
MLPLNMPIVVEAIFMEDGEVIPRHFTMLAGRHEVTSVGRSWDVEGEGRHILVMTGRDRVYELLLRLPALDWRVIAMFRADEGVA